MSKKSYTNKQQKQIRKPKVRIPVTGKTIFHKSVKDFDRRHDKQVIELELEMDELEGTLEEAIDEQRHTD